MRAGIEAIEPDAFEPQQFEHSVMYLPETVFVEVASSDAGLIRYYDQAKAQPAELSERSASAPLASSTAISGSGCAR